MPPRRTRAGPVRPSPAQALRCPVSPHGIPALCRVSCSLNRSSSLWRSLFDLIRTIGVRRTSSSRTFTRLTPQVVPGIQPLAASPVPKLVPEIQVPLHRPYLLLISLLCLLYKYTIGYTTAFMESSVGATGWH